MATKKGQEIEEPKVETMPPPEEPKPPTAEEQLATLQAEKAEVQRKYEETSRALSGTNASLAEKNRLLKEKENFQSEIETLKNMVKILATQKQGEEAYDLEETAKRKAPDIDKAFAELEQKQKAQEYQKKVQEQISTIQQRVEALGLKEDDERYWEIYKLATSATPADFKLADIRLKKIESEKEKLPVDNKPTDEQKKIEALTKEIERLKKVVSGELDTETGLPSGASANEAQIRKTFRENPNNAKAREDYLELMRNKTK